jgi:hypothetical protein
MASRKKTSKKKQTKSKRARKASRAKQVAKPGLGKKGLKKKQAKKRALKKRSAGGRKSFASDAGRLESSRDTQGALSGRQSGDLQGLSRAERADSESVDELVEEGNLFEAGAVAGVEEADNADEREVHTHEVPEDDVPEEYLDKD